MSVAQFEGQTMEGKVHQMMMRLSVPADEDLQRTLSFFEKVWIMIPCSLCNINSSGKSFLVVSISIDDSYHSVSCLELWVSPAVGNVIIS